MCGYYSVSLIVVVFSLLDESRHIHDEGIAYICLGREDFGSVSLSLKSKVVDFTRLWTLVS